MKTHPFARGIRRIRGIVVCLALVAMTVVAFKLGDTLARRFGQTTVSPTTEPQPPKVSLAEVMATVS